MKISREGSDRKQGRRTADLREPLFRLGDKAIIAEQHHVKDFGFSGSYHNYNVEISLSEIVKQLNLLARWVQGQHADMIIDELRPSLTALLRLALACTEERPTQE